MFAVIKAGGKQYRVATGDVLKVEKVTGNAGDKIEFHDVLVVGRDDEIKIGEPLVKGAIVRAEVIGQASFEIVGFIGSYE